MAQRLIEPIIKTADGVLRGRCLKSVLGGSYFSFQGVPYAQPPVGPLRFQPPKRVQPWIGERLALAEGPISPQHLPGTTEYVESSSEDCLYLNVYAKEINGVPAKKPVLVWIHGGGFFFGSGNTDLYGPDFLVLKDIVLITINYRLGALGFLSLQNDSCPGNNGLRDQVEALRWVQRNISSFGGDPDNVTIFGESAGGASVQFHMLSPLSRGLFHRAITQSGSVLNPWAMTSNPVMSAFKLGEFLGLKTENKDQLLEFLKTVPTKSLVDEMPKVMRATATNHHYPGSPFAPVVEPASPHAFLSEPVDELIKNGKLHDVPYMLGVNTLEGLIMTRHGLPPLQTTEELERLLPHDPRVKKGTPLSDSIVKKIQDFYFSNGYSEERCADALSAIYFLNGNQDVLNGVSSRADRKSNTYFYLFSFDCGISIFKPLIGFFDWKGTCHGDEIVMLFYSNMLEPSVEPGSSYEKMIKTFCGLWTDFAKNGNPTPVNKLWPAYTKNSKAYLDIGLTLNPGSDLNKKEMDFWADIFRQISGTPLQKL